ncbi:fasciclin domain-containing protein [Arenimonas sp.]|nr:fasciclin domain-containing protein [Candidatus Parcubacteria bacterium]
MMNNNDKMMTTEDTKNMTVTEDGVMVGGAMMVKSKDIVDNAINATNVTTLVAAVKAAGLVETLKGAGPFTVFAPTNAAFAKLPAKTVETLLKPENKATLVKILTYHVVAGRYTAADLKDGMTLKSVEGENLMIKKDTSGKITINGTAMVETADVISSNGVTFVIDTVLMPKIK